MGGGERRLERGDLFSAAALLIGQLGREVADDVARRPGASQSVRSPPATSILRAVQRLLDPLSVRFAADRLVRDPSITSATLGSRSTAWSG